MIKYYLKSALLSIIGSLLVNTSVLSMDRSVIDDEMPDNYKGIELEEEEETSTNPHRSLTNSVYAYYYCKTVNVKFLDSAENALLEIINTDNGKSRTEFVANDKYTALIDISDMGIGNYFIYIQLDNGVRYSGFFKL